MFKRSIHFLVFTLALLSSTAVTVADELPPGRITNPAGLQRFQGVAYNSALDEYLVIYQGDGIARVLRVGVDGELILPEIQISETLPGVSNVGIVYNPDDDGYLALFRSDTDIFGRLSALAFESAAGETLAPPPTARRANDTSWCGDRPPPR